MQINSFSDFSGQDKIKNYMSDAAKNDRANHAYILSGRNGSGRRTLARLFGTALLCEGDGDKPCNACRSCRMAASYNHPDLITLTHEKPTVISVREVRDQLIDSISVKPYYGGKKIYIVPDCEFMRQEGQNALLKSIEEPPSYAVIILITDNPASLLPTVRSRCTGMELLPLSDSVVKDHILRTTSANDREARICAAFAGGSIGMALSFFESEDFKEDLKNTLDFIKQSKNLPANEIFAFAKDISENKDRILNILDIILFMYRDILMYKSIGKDASLTFIDETGYIESKARETDYEEISKVLKTTEDLKGRLKSNANAEAALDVLFLDISV